MWTNIANRYLKSNKSCTNGGHVQQGKLHKKATDVAALHYWRNKYTSMEKVYPNESQIRTFQKS